MPLRADLDHVPFGVTDSDRVATAYADLGFTLATGECAWSQAGRAFRAASLTVVFADSYLDFIHIDAPGWRDHVATSPLYARGLAPSGLVLGCDDIPSTRGTLSAAGFETTPPYAIERRVAGADPESMHYEIFSLDRGQSALPLSFIRDASPQAMRRAPWLDHPNRVAGIRRLWVGTADPETARSDADRMFGAAHVGGTLLAGASSLQLALQGEPGLRGVRELLPAGAAAQLLAIEFETSDLTRVAEVVRDSGLRHADRKDGGIEVDPREGLGCGVAFVPAVPAA